MRSYILSVKPFVANNKWRVEKMLEDDPYRVFLQFKELHDKTYKYAKYHKFSENPEERVHDEFFKKTKIYCQIDEDNNGQLSYTEILGDIVQTMVLNENNLYNILDFSRDEYRDVCEMMQAVMDYKISHRI